MDIHSRASPNIVSLHVYTDFSKAVDRVNHCLLRKKLLLLGLNPILLKWISSYLFDRSQKVIFNNKFSDSLIVTSGVPQGSLLSPILFIMTFHLLLVFCFNLFR